MAEPDDQVANLNTAVINGITTRVTAAVHKTVAPASSVYVFTRDYTTSQAGRTLVFKKGLSYSLDAALKAALLAASAPMTAA